jgi:hypothetical protein
MKNVGNNINIALTMEAVQTSETSVNCTRQYGTTTQQTVICFEFAYEFLI